MDNVRRMRGEMRALLVAMRCPLCANLLKGGTIGVPGKGMILTCSNVGDCNFSCGDSEKVDKVIDNTIRKVNTA